MVNIICIGDQSHERSVVILDHLRNFTGIQLIVEKNIKKEEGKLIQGQGSYYCSKLKKGKSKTKSCSKLLCQMSKSCQYNQQTEPNQHKSEVRKYVLTKTWKVAVTASVAIGISENKQWFPCQKESQRKISIRKQSRSVMLHSTESVFMFATMQPRYIH